MASGPPTQPTIYERVDIHKSCKSLETLVNILNDYCEAASSIVALQKKLAKALRETAGLKVTGNIPANALNATASIFEVMSDIDTKFGKIADKECDAICADVRKWFKKLAKEERAHDDKLNSANIRIKQAGQMYEKKSKKNARDAAEEHSRYINLISTLGPEISQEKYNHALLVTQKHTWTTLSVAACLSRIADIEWVRSCEEVRRFAPTVGQLGEWRSLCEGGWTGSIPQDLPGSDDTQLPSASVGRNENLAPQRHEISSIARQDSRDPIRSTENTSDERTTSARNMTMSSGEPILLRKTSNTFLPPGKQALTPSPDDQNVSLDLPMVPFAGNEKWASTVGSVTSLSSFPSPPTHVPLPPNSAEVDIQQPMQPRPASTSPRFPPLAESPKSWRPEQGATATPALTDGPTSPGKPREGLTPPPIGPNNRDKGNGLDGSAEPQTVALSTDTTDSYANSDTRNFQTRRQLLQIPDAPQGIEKSRSSNSPGSAGPTALSAYKEQENPLVDEFGVDRSERYGQLASKSVNAAKAQELDRNSSSGSTSSIVAAMRNRYASAGAPSSPTPRDIPRLPLSVNDLASRYQPTDNASSPRRRVASPTDEQQPRSSEVVSPQPTPYSQDRSPDAGPIRFPSPSTEANMEELARRRRQRDELVEQELKQKEQAFLDRQREIEMRTRELERDRAQFFDSRNVDPCKDAGDSGHISSTTQPSNISEPQRRYSQFDLPTPAISQGRYSYSTTHLIPPSHSSSVQFPNSNSKSQPPSPVEASKSSRAAHADFCGCATCSASKYKTRKNPSPHDLRPPEPPISLRPEKPRGWIRRLSMPVGNAFSLDSKKSNSSLKGGLALSTGEDGRMRRSFEQGGVSNQSISNIGRR